jgi:hypothetical protein
MFMFQPDLFSMERDERVSRARTGERSGMGHKLRAPDVISCIAGVSERPKFTFMVLSLIVQAADAKGEAGPYVLEDGQRLRIRDWLAGAVFTMGQRDPKRLAIVKTVRAELEGDGGLPADPAASTRTVERVVRERLKKSGLSSISRAVSELVSAGLMRRYYAGFRVDHANRGAQREAVYVVPDSVRQALSGSRR